MKDSSSADRPQAVALRWAPDERAAPDVVGKGAGEVAARILELAREHGIPVREDADLLALLGGLDVGEEIPAELYEVVAQLLTYLYRLNGELEPGGPDGPGGGPGGDPGGGPGDVPGDPGDPDGA